MTPSTTDTTAYPTNRYTGKGQVWHHAIRMEIIVTEKVKKLNIASVFVSLANKLVKATGTQELSLFDTLKAPFDPATPPNATDCLSKFAVTTVDGKSRKVLLGFRLSSATPYSTLKSSIMPWMTKRNIVLCFHLIDSQGHDYSTRPIVGLCNRAARQPGSTSSRIWWWTQAPLQGPEDAPGGDDAGEAQ
jgi:hypothetical protein